MRLAGVDRTADTQPRFYDCTHFGRTAISSGIGFASTFRRPFARGAVNLRVAAIGACRGPRPYLSAVGREREFESGLDGVLLVMRDLGYATHGGYHCAAKVSRRSVGPEAAEHDGAQPNAA